MTTDRRILFFGDSFVAGVGDPSGLGWVGRVVAAAYAAGAPLTAYNLGVRRDTSLDVAARWRAEAAARIGPVEARHAFVVSFGVNDTTREQGRPRVAPPASAAALRGILEQAASLGRDVLVVGPPPAGEHEQDERVRELSHVYAGLCGELAVPFVETFSPLAGDTAWRREAAASDGAHPAAGGYAALAALVLSGGFVDWLD